MRWGQEKREARTEKRKGGEKREERRGPSPNSTQTFQQSPEFERGKLRESSLDVLRGPFPENPRGGPPHVAGDEMHPPGGDRPVLPGFEMNRPGRAAAGEVAHVVGAGEVDRVG